MKLAAPLLSASLACSVVQAVLYDLVESNHGLTFFK